MNIIRLRCAPLYHYSAQSVHNYSHTHIDPRFAPIQNGYIPHNRVPYHIQYVPRCRRCPPLPATLLCEYDCPHLHTYTASGMTPARYMIFNNVIPTALDCNYVNCKCVDGILWEGALKLDGDCVEEQHHPYR
jgi:hypothetical protein